MKTKSNQDKIKNQKDVKSKIAAKETKELANKVSNKPIDKGFIPESNIKATTNSKPKSGSTKNITLKENEKLKEEIKADIKESTLSTREANNKKEKEKVDKSKEVTINKSNLKQKKSGNSKDHKANKVEISKTSDIPDIKINKLQDKKIVQESIEKEIKDNNKAVNPIPVVNENRKSTDKIQTKSDKKLSIKANHIIKDNINPGRVSKIN